MFKGALPQLSVSKDRQHRGIQDKEVTPEMEKLESKFS